MLLFYLYHKKENAPRKERCPLSLNYLEALAAVILALMRALSFARAFNRRIFGVLRLSPRPITSLLEFNAVFTSILIEAELVDRADRSCANFQSYELCKFYRPETLRLKVWKEAVLSLDIGVRYAVSDLYALASEFTLTAHLIPLRHA